MGKTRRTLEKRQIMAEYSSCNWLVQEREKQGWAFFYRSLCVQPLSLNHWITWGIIHQIISTANKSISNASKEIAIKMTKNGPRKMQQTHLTSPWAAKPGQKPPDLFRSFTTICHTWPATPNLSWWQKLYIFQKGFNKVGDSTTM